MDATILVPRSDTEAEGLAEIETHVQVRLHGRVRDLRILVEGPGLVLRGHARSYYVKQLAQHAVMETTRVPILANEIEVV